MPSTMVSFAELYSVLTAARMTFCIVSSEMTILGVSFHGYMRLRSPISERMTGRSKFRI